MNEMSTSCTHLIFINEHCFVSSQSFLKELPGSLLVSELNDKWMTALDFEDAQQRAQEITK